MSKRPGPIPPTLRSPEVAVVADFANESIYVKLAPGYNVTNAKYGAANDDKELAGVHNLFDAMEGKTYASLEGRAMSVWWLDLAMWPHLIDPLCDRLKQAPQSDNRTAMLWNPIQRMRVGKATQATSVIRTMSVMGDAVLSFETARPGDQGKVGDFVKKVVAPAVLDAIYVDENDPRHIGTHWGAAFGTFHLHLLRPAGASWRTEIGSVINAAAQNKPPLLHEADVKQLLEMLSA